MVRIGAALEQRFATFVHVEAGKVQIVWLGSGIRKRQDLVGDRVGLRCQLVAPPLVKLSPHFVGDFRREGECVLQRTAAYLGQREL